MLQQQTVEIRLRKRHATERAFVVPLVAMEIGSTRDEQPQPRAVAPVQPRRVREMHRRTLLLQPIDDPIPAIGRFDHDLGARTRLRDRRRDRHQLIRNISPARIGPTIGPAAAIATGSFATRTLESFSPVALIRTTTDRRR